MIFTHDFKQDCDDLLSALEAGEPVSFARFADGERAVIEGRRFNIDGWVVPDAPNAGTMTMRAQLYQSLAYLHEDYHIGISCPCCDVKSNRALRQIKTVPDSRTTYSNVFVNGNAQEAMERLYALYTKGFAVLGSYDNATIQIERNMLFPFKDPAPILNEMEKQRGVLLAAGPYTCILIYKYLSEGRPPQALVDVGSALDPVFRVGTRKYHKAGHPNRSKICKNVV